MSDEELDAIIGLFEERIDIARKEAKARIQNHIDQALTDYKKELLSKAVVFDNSILPPTLHEIAKGTKGKAFVPLSAIQEDTTVTPNSENRNNDPKKTSQESVIMPENTRSSELEVLIIKLVATVREADKRKIKQPELLESDMELLISDFIASKVEEAYRKGYAAGNAKKNYHKKSDSNQAVDGLEIRVSALEYRLALQSKEGDS